MSSIFSRRIAALLLAFPGFALASELTASTPLGKPATKIYRQLTPEGQIVYSDELIAGAKVEETIIPDPDVEGRLWKPESGKRHRLPIKSEPTQINRVPSIPSPGRIRTFDDAHADVIKAEMLLEDAKERQKAGVEPLPGERTGLVSGKSRLNEQYHARQQALAEDVAAAEAMLKKAQAERNSLSRR